MGITSMTIAVLVGNNMKLTDLKERVIGDKKVRFSHYKQGNLYYKAENGFEFPVPVSDTGDAEFMAEDKALLFMRWIRQHLITVTENGSREYHIPVD